MNGLRRTLLIVLVAVAAVATEKLLWPSFAFPSITTLLIAVDLILNGRARHRDVRRIVIFAVGALGLLLYASVIGVFPIDLYGAGFSPFAPILLALAGIWLARSHREVAWVIVAVLLAFDLSLLRSRNLFDYVVDPAIVTVAVARMTARAARWRPHDTAAPAATSVDLV